jgi:N-acetylneuraminate lyase
MTEHLEGLIAAPFTPMHPDGTLNLDAVEPYAALLVRSGVVGAFVGGTTGESLSLAIEERMLLTEAWTDAAPDGLRVIVHAGAESLEEARMLAGHAADCGARGVAAMPPTFFKPDGVEGLVAWCAAVAEAAGALPFYYYHIPGLTGVHAAMAEFLPAAAARIDNLAGVKYTAEDLNDFSLTLDACGARLDVLYGRDETLLAGLALGARGAVGSTYNFAAPLSVRLMEALAAGEMDTARDLQRTSRQMIAALRGVAGSFLPAAKTVMAMVGLDCGAVRPPLVPLVPEQVEAVRAGLERLGFEDFRNR